MKYALLSFLLFVIYLSSGLSAQSDIEQDGFYYSSGTVYNGDQLTGYFTLQVGRVDDEIEKYTIKLLDRNADQIGKTVYQRKNEFALQHVTYNGTYLALLLKEENHPAYIDLLNAAGERVTRKTFDYLNDAKVTHLWSMDEGIMYVASYEVNQSAKNIQRRWRIGLLDSNTEGELKWEIHSDNPPKTSQYLSLLDANEKVLLFSIKAADEIKRKAISKVGLLAVDIATGAILFTHWPDDGVWGGVEINGAKLNSDGSITTLQAYNFGNNRLYTMRRFNEWGEQLSNMKFALGSFVSIDNPKMKRGFFNEHYLMETGHQFTEEGDIQLAIQPIRSQGSNLNFTNPQTIVIDTIGRLMAKKVVDIDDYEMKSKYLGISNGIGVLSRKGKGMMKDIQFHQGPLPYAGQQRVHDISIQYYFDREFSKEGVKYKSIHAIYYLDGELVEEVIPFESDADMVRIYPGKEGYFLVMEAYSDGSIKTRLERMDF